MEFYYLLVLSYCIMKLHSCAQEISVSELSIWAILLCRPIFTMKAVVLLTWNTNCYPTVLLNFFSKIMKDIVIIAQVSETQHLYCQIVLLSARWRDVVNKWVGKWVNYSTCRAPHQALARGGAKKIFWGTSLRDNCLKFLGSILLTKKTNLD